MLSNLEAEKHHLLQMILVGQPQLKEKLERKSLEQFVQRITVYCHLDALDKVQVDYYVRHRLKVAGAQNLDLFDTEALDAIYEHSHGIPRLINMLCDAALVYGYADDTKIIGRVLIDTVAQARPGKKKGLPDSLPEDEKIYEPATPVFSALLRQEFEGRFKVFEEKLAAQEERILNISKWVESLQGHRDERDKIMIQLLKMVKKNLDRQSDILAARLQEQGADLIAVVPQKKAKKKQPLILLKPKKKQEPDPAP